MISDSKKAFLTSYLARLNERTRDEKSGKRWGIDWVIYNLGLILYGKPVRLPFVRQRDGSTIKSKSEAEFGIDIAFLSEDRTQLVIFVLKDEALTNSTWTKNGFHEDLSKATIPDLEAEGLESVNKVEVILAYNSDEESNGVTLYERFVANAPRRIADRADLMFARWNLSELVDLSLKHLLTPALLPQRFFGQLSYLCAQAADFPHGSDEWEQQLIPAWKRLIDDALSEGVGVRGVSLLPVALIIIRQHASENKSIESGWIDLIEWAAIALWQKFVSTEDRDIRGAVMVFWDRFYLDELDRFYRNHIDALATPNAIDQGARASLVGAAAAAMVAHWHLGRLGVLSIGKYQSLPCASKEQQISRGVILREVANWMVRIVNSNECALRPLLDIHHIELALLALALGNANRLQDFGAILRELSPRLYLRRIGISELPFLDGRNSITDVFEQIAIHSSQKLITTQSSFFVLMMLEMCCLLDESARDELIPQIHRRLVMGAVDAGPQKPLEPLHLMSWIPPQDWDVKVFQGHLQDGESVSRGPFSDNLEATTEEIVSEMRRFILQMRETAPPVNDYKAPLAALVLASIKYQSPMPPDFWRNAAFPPQDPK